MQGRVNLSEFLKDIKKFNEALKKVQWDGAFFPITFSPKYAVVCGKDAKKIVKHLFITEKIVNYYELKRPNGKVYAIEFKK